MVKRTWASSVTTIAGPPKADDFQRVCLELHDNLVAAGMVVADDVGQLDFLTITAFTTNKNYGYRIYRLNDGLDMPLFLKIRFCGSTASAGGSGENLWTFYVSIGLGSSGTGALLMPTKEFLLSGSSTIWSPLGPPNTPRSSFVCVTKGFVGVSFKQLAGAASASYGPGTTVDDQTSLLSFFVCRDTNDAGEPTSDGASLVLIAPDGLSYSEFGKAPIACHLSSSGAVVESNRISVGLGADSVTSVGGKIPLSHIYTMTPAPRRISQLMCVNRAPGMRGNDEVQAVNVGTEVRNYLVMAPVWPADGFTGTTTRSCIAMLWE